MSVETILTLTLIFRQAYNKAQCILRLGMFHDGTYDVQANFCVRVDGVYASDYSA